MLAALALFVSTPSHVATAADLGRCVEAEAAAIAMVPRPVDELSLRAVEACKATFENFAAQRNVAAAKIGDPPRIRQAKELAWRKATLDTLRRVAKEEIELRLAKGRDD